uniref:Uncharacterized protein n=1 Tax=Glossina brevipalpis TaxID=37001 RepID=A0A1A9W287_9MUSC
MPRNKSIRIRYISSQSMEKPSTAGNNSSSSSSGQLFDQNSRVDRVKFNIQLVSDDYSNKANV